MSETQHGQPEDPRDIDVEADDIDAEAQADDVTVNVGGKHVGNVVVPGEDDGQDEDGDDTQETDAVPAEDDPDPEPSTS